MAKICTHCLISGRVQGVFYRAFAVDTAHQLGVTGWVKNIQDGKVELLACGEELIVQQFIAQLRRGPKLAVVKDINITELPFTKHEGFVIRYT